MPAYRTYPSGFLHATKTLAVSALLALVASLPGVGHAAGAAAPPTVGASVADLAKPSVLVIVRHANAPGVGDPAGYNLDRCETQRNLDERGRQQAADLGETWKAAGFYPSRIWSSAWCRCVETAQRMALGPVSLLPQLNSSFEDSASRASQTEALFEFIRNLNPKGGPYLMVTHQVNISAISNDWVDTGAGVVLDLKSDRTWTMRALK